MFLFILVCHHGDVEEEACNLCTETCLRSEKFAVTSFLTEKLVEEYLSAETTLYFFHLCLQYISRPTVVTPEC